METDLIIVVSVLGSTCLILACLVIALFIMVASLNRKVQQMQATGRIRVQKLKMNNDKNHAFHNAGLVPDEELSKRGYSMYMGDDVESQTRGPSRDQSREHTMEPMRERQAGGQLVNDLQREIDSRQQRAAAPPFLLQSIEDNKKKSRGKSPPYKNPAYNLSANGRQSETNPNFIY